MKSPANYLTFVPAITTRLCFTQLAFRISYLHSLTVQASRSPLFREVPYSGDCGMVGFLKFNKDLHYRNEARESPAAEASNFCFTDPGKAGDAMVGVLLINC